MAALGAGVSGNRFLTGVGWRLAYFSGYARLMQRRTGGAGVILRFERVCPARSGPFQPRRAHEITPQFLDSAIRALKRWKFEFVSIGDVPQRANRPASPRRFICLTFDGATRDVITSAYPVLARHGVPFTVYVPTAFPDGLGEAWWLALEAVIARNDRIALMMDGKERRFEVVATPDKYGLYDFLHRWMRSLAPSELSTAINDLCRRYSVDLRALSREASMDWDDLATLGADPNVTIASMTVNAPVLASLKEAAASREMLMGRAVIESALHRDVAHFAYPFGDRDSFHRHHVMLAGQAGFASAVTALPGVVLADGRSNLHALPRIGWDGRQRSLRMMRVMLSGVMLPKPQRHGRA
ncbi:polysaccharide deacetylase [uncultured Bradyrhizobium sp.]|uniref:polysaccharide deacetylase family protein n=1 Tax=uncultured Bradyrhizobium sp. TaxID=199684 RepID=UPI0035CAA96E